MSAFHTSPPRICCHLNEAPECHPLFHSRGHRFGSGHWDWVSPREQRYSPGSKVDGSSHTICEDPPAVSPKTITVCLTHSQDSIEGPIILGLGIGISSPCTTSQPCQPPSQYMGDVLYAGPFKPVAHPGPPGGFYQNFTVEIPTFVTKGKAQLNVILPGLIGVGFLVTPDERY